MAEELEQANEQLGELSAEREQARTQLEQAVDGMSDAMLVFDAEWRLVFANADGPRVAAARRSRCGCADGSRRVGRVSPPRRQRAPEGAPSRRERSDSRSSTRSTIPGRDLWLHVRGVPTPDGGLATFIQDVTATRRAELSRARSEERYRALVEASTIMVWTADPAGEVDDLPVWRDITGQQREEVRGVGWIEAIHPDDRRSVGIRWADAIASGRIFETDFRLLCAAGDRTGSTPAPCRFAPATGSSNGSACSTTRTTRTSKPSAVARSRTRSACSAPRSTTSGLSPP